MKNLEIYEKFRTVPQEAKKEIQAGRLKGFTDINPMWRIKMLTDQFGACGFGWYTDIVEQKIIEGSDKQQAAFVTINLFVKVDNEWSKPIVGVGGSSFVTNESRGAYTSDECFKMAYTDALSIACKSLGMGADVYFAKDRTKYDQEPQTAPPQTETAPPKTQTTPPKTQTAPQPTQEQLEQQRILTKWNAEKSLIGTDLNSCKTIDEVKAIWDKYPAYQKIKGFVDMINLTKDNFNA